MQEVHSYFSRHYYTCILISPSLYVSYCNGNGPDFIFVCCVQNHMLYSAITLNRSVFTLEIAFAYRH
jgi:hypothetical protein